MVDLEILLVYEEETLEVLRDLEETTSLKHTLRCLHAVSHSSKLVKNDTLSEIADQVSKSIEAAGELNSLEIKSFITEAKSLIQGAVQRAKLMKPKTKPKSAWWKIW